MTGVSQGAPTIATRGELVLKPRAPAMKRASPPPYHEATPGARGGRLPPLPTDHPPGPEDRRNGGFPPFATEAGGPHWGERSNPFPPPLTL